MIRLPHSVRAFEVEGRTIRFVCDCETVWQLDCEAGELTCDEGDPQCSMPSAERRWTAARDVLAVLAEFDERRT